MLSTWLTLLLTTAPPPPEAAVVEGAVKEALAAAQQGEARCGALRSEAAVAACRGPTGRAWLGRLRGRLQAGGKGVLEQVRAQRQAAAPKTPQGAMLTLALALLDPVALAAEAQGDRLEDRPAHQQRVGALCLAGAFPALEKALPLMRPGFAAMDLGVVVRDELDPKAAVALVERAEANAQLAEPVRAAARLLLALRQAKSPTSSIELGETLGACIDAPEHSLVLLRLGSRCEGYDGRPTILGTCVEPVRTLFGKAVAGALYANLFVEAPLGAPALGCATVKNGSWLAPEAVLLSPADLLALDRVYPPQAPSLDAGVPARR